MAKIRNAYKTSVAGVWQVRVHGISVKHALALLFLILSMTAGAQQLKVNYVDQFQNIHHPQVAYWFFTDKMMQEKRFKEKIDSFAQFSKYTLIFLTQRDNCDFYDIKTMHPVFEKLVAYAHTKGLQIALQVWKDDRGTRIENTDRLIQEGETELDANGDAVYQVKAKGARNMNTLLKSELFKIYAFKKTGDGFYDPASLQEISATAKVQADTNKVNMSIHAGSGLKGYTAYILTQHYYNSCSNFSKQSQQIIGDVYKAYADITFDGIGLDEYKNLQIARSPILKAANDSFRERLYGEDMARAMERMYKSDMNKTLLNMRYAPTGDPGVRIKAINQYMALLRTGTLAIETMIYDLGKKMYGPQAFIGLHDTYHNNLDHDEVWQTGVNWWNIKRDYGHTDENIIAPIQLGVGISYRQNAMYNMYYDKSLDKLWTKALTDLRYGVRTHYHAANDVDGWGVSIDDPAALVQINKVENAARLMNRFNPLFPNARLLVIYGMEAQYNWYPNKNTRGVYDVNDKLDMDGKSVLLWKEGYIHAAVPTDLIADGRLKLNKTGQPELNGYTFDAVVFLNPEYARQTTIDFLHAYVQKGGKLLLEGTVTHDFNGQPVGEKWKDVSTKATVHGFSLDNIPRLGIVKNELTDGVSNADGSFVFTNVESVKTNQPANFSFRYHSDIYSGTYKGFSAISINNKGELEKLAATGFQSFKKNGKEILHTDKPVDIFLERKGTTITATLADPSSQTHLTINQ